MFSLRPGSRGRMFTAIPLFLISMLLPGFSQTGSWKFAVSGDSRNCGDVVMPVIAAKATKNRAAFYWHLGDLRRISQPDEDYQHEPEHQGQPPDRAEYLKTAWDDYIQNQITPFGSMPVFVGIGNHELIPPKTRQDFVSQFSRWLDSPALQKQRQADGDNGIKTYYHWIQGGVDFINLDNATPEQFDAAQMAWFEDVLKRAGENPEVHGVVVGMHEALPDSLAAGHSMSDFPMATESGRKAYADLLRFHDENKKPVYIMASHSHFYMRGIFDSDYWRAHGGVLPGWIIGTAGAVRYALPPGASRAQEARTKIYGFLLGTVHPDGSIDFDFQEIKRKEVPASVSRRYTPQFVDFCFNENTSIQRKSGAH